MRPENKTFYFASGQALRILDNCALWSMDGTFKTVPYIAGAKQLPWTQLLSIHGVVKYDGVIMGSIPLVYMLLIGKSAKVYETAFEGLVEKAPKNDMEST